MSLDNTTAEPAVGRMTDKAQVYVHKKRHISEEPVTFSNWYKHLHWIHITFSVLIPFSGIVYAFWTPLQWNTYVFTCAYYTINGIGVTAGYHRLWAHRSFDAATPLKVFLAFFGSAALQDSVRVWAREHRAHHRYIDTDKDPYNAGNGLWMSHMGWLLVNSDPKKMGRVDISDLNEDAVVRWQHKNYLLLVILAGFVIPTVVCGLAFGDWQGGFVYGGLLRTLWIQQTTFCINSFVHYFGTQPYDDKHTPRNNWWCNLVLFGEGYHNYHHEYPTDHRAGTSWYHYEPTKWFIHTMKFFGLASGLKVFSQDAVRLGMYQQEKKRLLARGAALKFGKPLEELPTMEWDEFTEQVKEGRSLICVSGVIHDVGEFMNDHPGGPAMIKSGIGKDATGMFNGGVYDHTNAAHHLLTGMRVAALRGGMEVEIWKKYAP